MPGRPLKAEDVPTPGPWLVRADLQPGLRKTIDNAWALLVRVAPHLEI